MFRSHHRLVIATMLLFASALLAPSTPSFGQPGQPIAYGHVSGHYAPGAVRPTTPVAPVADVQQVARVLLPIIYKATETTPLQFAAQANDQTGELINPAVSFNNIGDIYVASTVTGGQGQEYKLVWTIDGKVQTGLEDSGTIGRNPEVVFEHVCQRKVGNLNCSGTPVRFPPSTFVVQLFLNGVLVQQAQAVVS